MNTTTTPEPDVDQIVNTALMMLRHEVTAGEKAAASLAKAAAADPVGAVKWASGDLRAVLLGRIAAKVLGRLGDDHTAGHVWFSLRAEVEHATQSLLERWDNPTSSSMFSNAVTIEEGDAKAQFVGRFRHHVEALTEVLS